MVKVSKTKNITKKGVVRKNPRKKAYQQVKDIRDNFSASRVTLADGSKTPLVDAQTANVVVTVHDALSKDNQKRMEAVMDKNRAGFMRVVDFSWSQVG